MKGWHLTSLSLRIEASPLDAVLCPMLDSFFFSRDVTLCRKTINISSRENAYPLESLFGDILRNLFLTSLSSVLWNRERLSWTLPGSSYFNFPHRVSFFPFLYSTFCLFMDKCLYFLLLDMFIYSFFLIPFTCILCISKDKCSWMYKCVYPAFRSIVFSISHILMQILVLSKWELN